VCAYEQTRATQSRRMYARLNHVVPISLGLAKDVLPHGRRRARVVDPSREEHGACATAKVCVRVCVCVCGAEFVSGVSVGKRVSVMERVSTNTKTDHCGVSCTCTSTSTTIFACSTTNQHQHHHPAAPHSCTPSRSHTAPSPGHRSSRVRDTVLTWQEQTLSDLSSVVSHLQGVACMELHVHGCVCVCVCVCVAPDQERPLVVRDIVRLSSQRLVRQHTRRCRRRHRSQRRTRNQSEHCCVWPHQ
jgi:hypothetical protein